MNLIWVCSLVAYLFTKISAGMTFGMSKMLRIPWLYVALITQVVCNISNFGANSLGMKVSLIAIKYSTSILSLTFMFLFKRLPS